MATRLFVFLGASKVSDKQNAERERVKVGCYCDISFFVICIYKTFMAKCKNLNVYCSRVRAY